VFTLFLFCCSKEHLGVVGVDIPLENLESLFRDELWAHVHAFMAILTDGSPLIHPLMRLSYKVRSTASLAILFLLLFLNCLLLFIDISFARGKPTYDQLGFQN